MINRYGFPSEGAAAVLARLKARIPPAYDVPPFPSPSTTEESNGHASLRENALLAINLGKNKSSPPESINDFVNGVKMFGPYADVLVVNVSSPNTPGLRCVYGLNFNAHVFILHVPVASKLAGCCKNFCQASDLRAIH
jgi:dihydroorotate dehydrogenase